MGYEIDVLAVGDGESSGDVIALRSGDFHGSQDRQTVVVVDGGFKAAGEESVRFLPRRYGADWVKSMNKTTAELALEQAKSSVEAGVPS